MLFDVLTDLLDPLPHEAALNMALDEVLLRTAQAPLLRIYSWARPAVSFGYFGSWEEAAHAWPGRELVRRWTGGGIVPHGDDLTYTVIVPRGHPFAARNPLETYRAIHDVVARILDAASLAAENGPKVSAACFENPVQHDVLVDGQKVAGAAQRRTRFGLLHQGSIQLPASSAPLGPALSAALAPQRTCVPLSRETLAEAEILAKTKYQTDAWQRRR